PERDPLHALRLELRLRASEGDVLERAASVEGPEGGPRRGREIEMPLIERAGVVAVDRGLWACQLAPGHLVVPQGHVGVEVEVGLDLQSLVRDLDGQRVRR